MTRLWALRTSLINPLPLSNCRTESRQPLLSPAVCVLHKATAQKGAATVRSYSYQLHIKAQCDGVNINEADIPADKKKKHLVLIHIPSHSISRSLCLALTATSMSQRGGVEIPQWTCSWFKTEIELKIPFQESPGITGRYAGLGVQCMEFFLLVPRDVNIIGK